MIIKIINQNRRLCIGFGCIPAACALYFRLTIPESPRYTIEINNDIDTLVKDVDIVVQNKMKEVGDSGKETNENKATLRDFLFHFKQWKNLKVLIGCSVSWFALDVAFYGINLNTSIIISSIGFSGDLHTNSTIEIWNCMFSNTVGNIIGNSQKKFFIYILYIEFFNALKLIVKINLLSCFTWFSPRVLGERIIDRSYWSKAYTNYWIYSYGYFIYSFGSCI